MQNSPENQAAAMQQAQARAQAGDLKGAAAICRGVLERAPNDVYALFMLGTIESEFKHYDEAAKLLGKAAKSNPNVPEVLCSLGNVFLELKRYREAIEVLSKAIGLQPQNQHALLYRGLAFAESGESERALKDFDRILTLDPRSEFALHNRANVLIKLDRHDEALANIELLLRLVPNHVPGIVNLMTVLTHGKKYEQALRVVDRALSIEPNNPELWNSRGQLLHHLKRHDEALTNFARAVQLKPDSAEFQLSLGNLHLDRQRFDAALQCYDRAIALNTKFAEAHLSSANVWMERQELARAVECCEKALAIRPDYAPAMLLRANIFLHLGRRDPAFKSFDAAIAAAPDYHDAYYHRGSARLLTGQFQAGWRDFEHRWKVADCGFDRPILEAAEWQGEPLKGKSLVVYSEQGLGDTIQFARFLPDIARTGAKVTFLCHPNLIRLFQVFAGEMELTGLVEADRRFDFQCALMSLPLRLGIGLEDIPRGGSYLVPENDLVAAWQTRIGETGFKVGLCWQGNPEGTIDKGRSILLEKYLPLASVPGVRLISLQKDHGLEQLSRLPPAMNIETLHAFDGGKDSFIDTAAIMQNLDLVITSDTAIPHLAGALNRPAWVALKHIPDWRWMIERDDSPWYKSLRLFRQPVPGDWDTVFRSMAEDLRRLVGRDA